MIEDDIFYIKRGDRSPSIKYQLPATMVLTGATVVFNMMNAAGVLIVNRAAAVIEDLPNRIVRYDWAIGDTARAGDHHCEFEITYAGGKPETSPNDKVGIYIKIIQDIA